MNKPQFNRQRLDELLAQRAVFELSKEEQAELDGLLLEAGGDLEAFDRTAALAALAMHSGIVEPLPEKLKAKIAAAAIEHVTKDAIGTQRRSYTESQSDSRGRRRREITPWLITAASLLIALFSWLTFHQPSKITESLVEARATLERAPDTIRASWTATEDPSAKGASGDVVWNNAKQEGFLRFHGLAANDAKKSQYQLWIFDGNQDERYPIDGGVFDVDAKTGDTIVPIHAKLRVSDPKMFAVTVEKPGGVVVSSRERIALIAKPPGTS